MNDTRKLEWESEIISDSIKLRCFLHDVDSLKTPLWAGEPLFCAVFRYVEIFLPMYAAHLHGRQRIHLNSASRDRVCRITEVAKSILLTIDSKSSQPKDETLEAISQSTYFETALSVLKQSATIRPIPSIDVAFCWAMHRLSTPDYNIDCKNLYGCVLPGGKDASVSSENKNNGLDNIGSTNIDTLQGAIASLQWYCFACSVGRLETWSLFRRKNFQPGYMKYLPSNLYPIQKMEDLKLKYKVEEDFRFNYNYKYPLSYNLVAAAQRQKNFFYNISIPYFDDKRAVRRGTKRYLKFLDLMKTTKMYFVPAYDIDLSWHAHILRSTEEFERHTMEITGRIIDHQENDNREADGKLSIGFKRTRALWEKTYGEEYVNKYTQFKGWVPRNELRVFPYSRGEI